MPVLFLSGKEDELVPPIQMRTLYELCPCKHKEFHTFKNATHSTYESLTGLDDTCFQPEYFDIIASYLLKYIVEPDGSDLTEIQEEDSEKQTKSSAKDPDDAWDDERKAIL